MSVTTRGRVPVETYWQDQHTDAIIAHFNQVTNQTTLSGPIALNDRILPVVSATGISVGTYLILFDAASIRFSTFFVTAVNSLNITVDSPSDFAYPAGTNVDVATTELGVNGSATPQVFGLRGSGAPPGVELTFHVTRLIFQILTSSNPALDLFGNLTALTNGLLLRARNGKKKNIFNVKTNGELQNLMYDVDYFAAVNPVQGTPGLMGRLTFGSPGKMGVVIELPIGEDLEFWVQDNLSGLDHFHVIAEGHIVEE